MIVVTGATGNIGRPLTRALAEAGREVVAVSRHRAAVPDGVRHVVADLARPGELTAVLPGAEALFLLLSGDLHAQAARPADLIGEAVAAGVRRVVLLSTQGVVTRPFGPTRIAMRGLEDVLRDSGLEWAILRPGGFASNALWWAESVRAQRLVAAPFGDVGVPVIDPADIAEVAAAALLDDRHIGGEYELTGPEVVTPRQQTEALAAALGSPVRFHELTRDEARAAMSRSMPAELADDTLDILGSPSPAELRVSPDVERVLGRAPRPFADWAVRNVAAFR
ncbi:NAD(P)H-binding protein [Kitasatospora aureofaciens]|uniref:NmrA family transcriptional regulator n=1 Tax=Kitasatospora aureofaciens TaxID=1894 RepID=A0A1E7NE10_KITAU|nr:NAD(P)H-binding protein [Kitasatospora aureofaciens]QEV02536.1 NAD-dependent epimerase/dehydratase family protein [Streptomyces viridifaciens]ARF81313.1 NmrA family transcriptional regulator [Kitasatospora aureofaciens]OEV38904.1 NmrA family transcriptional regulator [Kitasatospora aureofaciens]UKZ09103.1 NAD(P)H-binding protein [Streptomyces viridifaciens]GGU54351.1 NmrA family transcriptional regulator [Kitasatospora aureofaciens]